VQSSSVRRAVAEAKNTKLFLVFIFLVFYAELVV